MRHFLATLLGIYFSIGVLLLFVGPLSQLMAQTAADVRTAARRNRQNPPSMWVSKLTLGLSILFLWPCLWPTAVYRPDFSITLSFEIAGELEGLDMQSLYQLEADRFSASMVARQQR